MGTGARRAAASAPLCPDVAAAVAVVVRRQYPGQLPGPVCDSAYTTSLSSSQCLRSAGARRGARSAEASSFAENFDNGHVYSGWDKICNPQPWTDATRPEWVESEDGEYISIMTLSVLATRRRDLNSFRIFDFVGKGSQVVSPSWTRVRGIREVAAGCKLHPVFEGKTLPETGGPGRLSPIRSPRAFPRLEIEPSGFGLLSCGLCGWWGWGSRRGPDPEAAPARGPAPPQVKCEPSSSTPK